MNTSYPVIYAFTLIKDEQRYLDEWIEHNLNIGFDKIVLYEEFNSSPHDVSKYGNKVILLKTPDCYNDDEKAKFYKHTFRQHPVYDHFNRVYRSECDWFCFMDVDEFIEIDDVRTIIDENYDQLIMKFKYYSYSGYIADPYPGKIYSVKNTYTEVLADKTTDKIAHLGFVWKSLERSASELLFAKSEDAYNIPHCMIDINHEKSKFTDVRLAHYWTRSLDEYIYKLFNQGLLDNEWWSRKLENFFTYNCLNIDDYKEHIKDYIGKPTKTNEDY